MKIPNKDITQLADYIEQLTYRMKIMEHTCLCALPCDVSLPEIQVLVYLGQTGPSRMSDIAGHMFTSLSNLTVIVDKLVKKELAERRRSEEDRRVVIVEMTEKGKEHYTRHHDIKLQLSRRILAALDDSDRKIYLDLVKKIIRNIK